MDAGGALSLDSLFRAEILFSADLAQWITLLLTSSEPKHEHERETIFEQLSLIQKSSQVYSIAPVRGGNGSAGYDRIVILGPSDKLKRASMQADVFLNT